MARYRKIDVRMWGDAKFRRLTPPQPCGQALWWYLLTNPNTTNLPGLYRAGEAQLAEELGWSLKAFREAFQEVAEQGLAEADWGARLVWIPGAMKYHAPESPNVVKSWAVTWDELPECPLKDRAFQGFKAFTEGLGKAFREAFAKSCPKPSAKTLANQEQEQEQEQEQDPEEKDLGLAPEGSLALRPVDSSAEKTAEVVKHYRGYHPAAFPRGLTGSATKVGKLLREQLQKYSVDAIKTAIDGYHHDPWHLGANEKNTAYLSLSLIVRDEEHVQKGIEMARRGPPPVLSDREKQSLLATQRFLAKSAEGES